MRRQNGAKQKFEALGKKKTSHYKWDSIKVNDRETERVRGRLGTDGSFKLGGNLGAEVISLPGNIVV